MTADAVQDYRYRPKEVVDLDQGDWFTTKLPDRLVSWVARSHPEDFGGGVGWAIKALPLEDPEGKAWPEGLSREPQWIRLEDIFLPLTTSPGGLTN